MATTPFVQLTGNLKIGEDSGSAVSVADAVASFTLRANRAVATIPATLATGEESVLAGASTYEIEIEYLGDDTAASALFMQLWEATDPDNNPTGELYFEGQLHGTGAVGASNPKWSGNFIVSGAAIGGKVGDPVIDRQTFRLTARPTKAIA